MSYYKTNHPGVLAEYKQVQDAKIKRNKEIKAFEELFGGTAIVATSITGSEFAGLRFNPYKSIDLWTVPAKDRYMTQRLRAKVPKALRDEHTELVKKWNDNAPKTKVSYDHLYKSIGTDWGSVAFSSGRFKFFEFNGFFYVETSRQLAEFMIEILGSEFNIAEKSFSELSKTQN
jgi:hypothetical protein